MDVTVEELKSALAKRGQGPKVRELATQQGLTEEEFLRAVLGCLSTAMRSLAVVMGALVQAARDATFGATLLNLALEKLREDAPEMEEPESTEETAASTTG